MALVGTQGTTDFLQSFPCEPLHLLATETGLVVKNVKTEFVEVLERLEIPANPRQAVTLAEESIRCRFCENRGHRSW